MVSNFEMEDPNRSRSSSDWNNNNKNLIKPKHEKLDFDLAFESLRSREVGDNVASSSRSYLRSFFTEMGYSPSLVNRVIEENGIVMNGHKHSFITLFFDRIGNGL